MDNAKDLRDRLKDVIDATLIELGEMEFELPDDMDILEHEEEKQDEINKATQESTTDSQATNKTENK
ncbi:TPA: hypothetical protein RRU56_005177 [Klebsiella pneumoniae]|nr:hypothetical protein [Klebsiella pneumoniae]